MLEFYTETGGTTIFTTTQTPEITFQGSLSGTTVAFTGVAGPMGADGAQGVRGEPGLRGVNTTVPVDPEDGEVWATTSGLYVRLNGVTYKTALTVA